MQMRVSKRRLLNYGLLLAFVLLLVVNYNIQIFALNEYFGYKEIVIDLAYFSCLLLGMFCIATSLEVRRPSDFFTLFYSLFVLFPYIVLYPIRGNEDGVFVLLNFMLLYFPLFAIRCVSKFPIRLHAYPLLRIESFILFLMFICFLGVIYSFYKAPASAGFDIFNSYDRRLEGRDIFVDRSVPAYMVAMIVNSFAPMLAFYAGLNNRLKYLVVAIGVTLSFYYVLGLKAPILYVFLSYVLAKIILHDKLKYFANWIFLFLLAVLFFSLVEYLFFDYSFFADYFVRRAFTVPAFLNSAYFDFIFKSDPMGWSWLYGIKSEDVPIPFLIGESFLGQPGLNANSNAFVYQLAGGGFVSYLSVIFFVGIIFFVIDAMHRSTQSYIWYFIGFIYGLLIVEQAATTAFASSGIGLLIISGFLLKKHT
jgi:hypothetical protein